jgi:hypothetical protein
MTTLYVTTNWEEHFVQSWVRLGRPSRTGNHAVRLGTDGSREDLDLKGGARPEAGAERREEGASYPARRHHNEPETPGLTRRNSRDVGQFGFWGQARRAVWA